MFPITLAIVLLFPKPSRTCAKTDSCSAVSWEIIIFPGKLLGQSINHTPHAIDILKIMPEAQAWQGQQPCSNWSAGKQLLAAPRYTSAGALGGARVQGRHQCTRVKTGLVLSSTEHALQQAKVLTCGQEATRKRFCCWKPTPFWLHMRAAARKWRHHSSSACGACMLATH